MVGLGWYTGLSSRGIGTTGILYKTFVAGRLYNRVFTPTMGCMGSNACGQNNNSLLRLFWMKQEPELTRLFLLAILDNKQEQGSLRQALHWN